MNYKIKMLWDEESDVWVATSDDVPGLVLESGSFDALVERLKIAVPELIQLNGKPVKESYLLISSERDVPIPVYG